MGGGCSKTWLKSKASFFFFLGLMWSLPEFMEEGEHFNCPHHGYGGFPMTWPSCLPVTTGTLWQWQVESTAFIVFWPSPAVSFSWPWDGSSTQANWHGYTQRQPFWCGSGAWCKEYNQICVLDLPRWLDEWLADLPADSQQVLWQTDALSVLKFFKRFRLLQLEYYWKQKQNKIGHITPILASLQ